MMLCASATLAPAAFAETEMIPVTGSLVTSELTGTVTVVDLERRMLTIRTPEGPFEVIHVPDQVTRLDQVKIGNKLTVSQTEAVVVDLQKGPSAGSVSVTKETVTERDPGRKPGGTIIDTMTRSGRVEAVDKVNSKVTVRGPTQTQTFSVRDPALLKEVAVGDGVVLTYMRVIRGEVTFK
jgi:hypothetical protein